MDCVRRPINVPKICAQSNPSFRKRRFRQISLNSAAAVRASEKVQLSLIGSWQCAFHRAIDEPCALPRSPPKGGSKVQTIICTFGVAFHWFVAGNRRHFKFGMWIEHSKFQPTGDELSLKGTWSLSRDFFNFWKISDDIAKNGTR